MKHIRRLNMQKLSTLHLTRHFANAMLYAVLFCSMSCKYVGVAEGNLFFFGGGQKMEGKSSFAVFGFAVGGADCKCAFPYALDFSVCFVMKDARNIK